MLGSSLTKEERWNESIKYCKEFFEEAHIFK